jgi:phosphinothricin acetyltransferase
MVVVRDATRDDLPEIAAIFNALLATTTYAWTEIPYTLAEREAWFAQQTAAGRPAFVAVDATEVVGCASYGDFRDAVRWPGYRPTVEHSIHVRRDCWGRGIGRLLVEALTDRARSDGVHVMVAAIDASNVRSIGFHEQLGFFEVARMPEIGEKFGRRLDLVLMQRFLDDRPS